MLGQSYATRGTRCVGHRDARVGNVEDRRGAGGIGMAPMGIGGTVILLVLSLIFGRDFV